MTQVLVVSCVIRNLQQTDALLLVLSFPFCTLHDASHAGKINSALIDSVLES
jgi:hypothetical protein